MGIQNAGSSVNIGVPTSLSTGPENTASNTSGGVSVTANYFCLFYVLRFLEDGGGYNFPEKVFDGIIRPVVVIRPCPY